MIQLNTQYTHFEDAFCLAMQTYFKNELPVVVCIGSDSAVGDSFGPLVGTFLKQGGLPTYIYGCLHNTVNAKNIYAFFDAIAQKHQNRKILCIDACLGTSKQIGSVAMDNVALFPGVAAGKSLGSFGDFSVLGITDQKTENCFNLFHTRLSVVYTMARRVADALLKSFCL